MSTPTYSEHLQWCKDRALKYLKHGNTSQALDSMFSDLSKHEETRHHPAIVLGAALMLGGHLSTSTQVREFIEGFH